MKHNQKPGIFESRIITIIFFITIAICLGISYIYIKIIIWFANLLGLFNLWGV